MNTEFKAGALVAFGGYAQAIVYGMLAFAPLGQAGLAYGIYAGLASALLGGAIGALFGKAPVQFGGPRSSTALIVAGSLLGFQQATSSHIELMLLLALELVLAGALIALAQRQGLGKLMQFLPAPVLIGMNTTLGLFSAYKLLPAMLGFAVYTTVVQAMQMPAAFSAMALGVSAVTIAVLMYFRAIRPNPLGLVYGLSCGLAVHALLLVFWPGELSVQTVAATPGHPLWAATPAEISTAAGSLPALFLNAPGLLLQLLVGAAVLALLVVLESMQSLLQVDQALGTRHNTRRELNTLAAANVLCGLALALPSSNYFSRSNAGLGLGATQRRSEGWYAVLLLLLLAATWPILPQLPLHILATAVALSSLFLIQGSTLQLVARFLIPTRSRQMAPTQRFTVWVVFSMVLVTGLSNLLIGTLAGVLFVAAYFLQQQSSSGLRSIEFKPAARSRSMRPRAHRQQLDMAFEHLAWVRFDGNLFFGNAPAIAIRLQDELAPAEFILLDFSQLRYIDDTACDCIDRLLKQSLLHRNTVAVLPNMPTQPLGGESLLRQILTAQRVSIQSHVDDAFWHLENQLLAHHTSTSHKAVARNNLQALYDSHLCDHMNPAQADTFARYWTRLEIGVGQTLFSEGAQPCGLYVLAQGQLSAWHHTGHSNERLMRFCPGSMVGEMALIDGKPRSATVRADTPCTVLFLPLDQFEALSRQETDLGQILQNNLARELALRIRLANQSLALTQ